LGKETNETNKQTNKQQTNP